MRYIIRAVKYFVQISITMTIILVILMALNLVSWDVNVAFNNGWRSVALIAGMFAVVSAIYPIFGYGKRQVVAAGDPAQYKEDIKAAMDARDYKFVREEEGGAMVFQLRSPFARMFRLWEDKVTIEPVLGGFTVEGLSRDIARIASSLTYKFRSNE